MTIAPDTKDWTWVLERPCPECGFDAATVTGDGLPERIRTAAQAMHGALHDEAVRERPDERTWSPLEYAAHVRDVCIVMRRRLALIVDQDDPEFPDWDQDAAAVDGRYDEQRPARVAIELDVAAAELAAAFANVHDDVWQRRGRRSNGSEFTAWTLGVYALHDLEHHVWDVERHHASSGHPASPPSVEA